MNETLQKTVADLLQTVQRGVVEYGPQAWEVVRQVRRAEALVALLPGLVVVVLALLLWKPAVRAWRWCCDEADELVGCYLMFGSFVALVAGTVWCLSWLDGWNWVALFAPELAIAHDLMQAVLDGVKR